MLAIDGLKCHLRIYLQIFSIMVDKQLLRGTGTLIKVFRLFPVFISQVMLLRRSVHVWKPLAIIAKRSILDVAVVLDLSLYLPLQYASPFLTCSVSNILTFQKTLGSDCPKNSFLPLARVSCKNSRNGSMNDAGVIIGFINLNHVMFLQVSLNRK